MLRAGMAAGIFWLAMTADAQAQDVIEYPNNIDATIQDAVLRAGCGGTVHLAPGIYTGSDLSDDPSPIDPRFADTKVGHVFIECGGRLIGSGAGETIIDGTNTHSPALGSPVIGLGFDPFNIRPVTGGYEVAHLTLRNTLPAAQTTPQALATGWSYDVEIHHLEVTGFSTAIRADLANDVEVHHVVARGLAPTIGRCVEFRELNFFLPGALPPDGHMAGNSVHHNDLADCLIGINVVNNDGVSVHNNVVQRTSTAAQFVASVGSEFHQNLIGPSLLRGLNLANANDSAYHHNVYCQNPIAVRYANSTAPALFGVPPSSNNDFHHETFLGSPQVFSATADLNLGPGNDLSLEEAEKSTSDPQAACPAF
jgi:hypothetical protein